MKKQNYHHEYRFLPIFWTVVIYAIIPVGLIAGFILHPIYMTGIFAIYFALLAYRGKRLRMIGRKKLMKGEAELFRDVRFIDGSRLTNGVFGLLFGIYEIPMLMISDRGPIALIHGRKSYRKGFWNGEKQISTVEMADLFPRGLAYWLVSCHNSYHGNFARQNQLFRRPVSTMCDESCTFDFSEKTGAAIVWGGPELEEFAIVYTPFAIYVKPLLKAFIKRVCPFENLLHNGQGDRRNQVETAWDGSPNTIRSKPV